MYVYDQVATQCKKLYLSVQFRADMTHSCLEVEL